MDPFKIFWTLFLGQFSFKFSNCGDTDNHKTQLEAKPNVDGSGQVQNSAQFESPSVDKSRESSDVEKPNTTKPRSYKDVLNNMRNSGTPGKPIPARLPLEGKNLSNTKAQAKPSEPSNAANVDVEKKSKTKVDEEKTKVKAISPKKKTDKLEDTKTILNEKRAKSRLDGKSMNTKARVKIREISNAAAVDKKTNSTPNQEELKIKESDITRKKETEKAEDTKKNLDNVAVLKKTGDKVNDQTPESSTTPSTSYSVGNRRSNARLNPNAAIFQPNANARETSSIVATIPLKYSHNSKELSLNPNAPTFQPKIYPLVREMSLLSELMRKSNPQFPLFEDKFRFPNVLIVTYNCLHTRRDADAFDEPSMITSISIFESNTGELVYRAYPELQKIHDITAYRNVEILDQVDPRMRRNAATIGKEISREIKGRVVVGINLGKIITIYKIETKPFNVREITSLAKFADILSRRPDSIGQHTLWFRNHKELLGTFLPELRNEFRPETVLTEEDKKNYILRLFVKLRRDWETEVEFLRRLFRYYKTKPDSELREVMDHFGKTYPGLHNDRPSVVYRPSSLPKELIGLHIRYDKQTKTIVSIMAVDSNLNKTFKAFVRDVGNVRLDSNGALYGPFESLVDYIFENKLLDENAIIVGFDVYRLAQIFDWRKKLKGARIYDTKIIFDAETVTELALKYLKIDYRYTFLRKFSYARRSEAQERKSFEACDILFPVQFAAKISMQMFRLYALEEHSKVQPLKLWE